MLGKKWRWCPNGCGKRVEYKLRGIYGWYECTDCRGEFTLEELKRKMK